MMGQSLVKLIKMPSVRYIILTNFYNKFMQKESSKALCLRLFMKIIENGKQMQSIRKRNKIKANPKL